MENGKSIKTSFWNPIPTTKLLEDERFKIDPNYFAKFLQNKYVRKYEITRVKLSEIFLERNKTICQLEDAEPYKLLQKNKNDVYFNGLIQNIEENDYDEKTLIIINYHNAIMDGQHRSCCLMYKYGKDYEVKVLKLDVTSTPIFSFKLLLKLFISLIPLQKIRKDLRKKYII